MSMRESKERQYSRSFSEKGRDNKKWANLACVNWHSPALLSCDRKGGKSLRCILSKRLGVCMFSFEDMEAMTAGNHLPDRVSNDLSKRAAGFSTRKTA